MNAHKEKISSFRSVFHMTFHLIFLFGLINVLSKDMGVSLIYVFIFLIMAFTGGVSYLWFLAGIGFVAVAFPVLWPMLDDYQRLRIQVLLRKVIYCFVYQQCSL